MGSDVMSGPGTFDALAGLSGACAQHCTDPPFVEMIVAQLDTIAHQNRHQLVVTCFKCRVSVDVYHLDLRTELGQ